MMIALSPSLSTENILLPLVCISSPEILVLEAAILDGKFQLLVVSMFV